LLDRTFTDCGAKANGVEAELHNVVVDEVERIQRAARGADIGAQIGGANMEGLRPELLKLSQTNGNEAWLKTSALSLGQKILAARWRVYEDLSSSIQWPLVYILVFWLAGIFFSLGITAPNNFIALGGLFVASAALAAAILLMLELDTPYDGLITVSTEPLQAAREQLSASRFTTGGAR